MQVYRIKFWNGPRRFVAYVAAESTEQSMDLLIRLRPYARKFQIDVDSIEYVNGDELIRSHVLLIDVLEV